MDSQWDSLFYSSFLLNGKNKNQTHWEGEAVENVHAFLRLPIRALGGTLESVTNCAILEEQGTSS